MILNQFIEPGYLNQINSANYPRRELGGARPTCQTHGLVNRAKPVIAISRCPASGAGSHTALAINAGGPCSRFTHAECLSPPATRTARLLVEDSSISARIACKSSEAEITGNSRTSTHPNVSKHCNELMRRATRASAPRRHSQYPGTASSTHARLSSSSMHQTYYSITQRNASLAETPNSSQHDPSKKKQSVVREIRGRRPLPQGPTNTCKRCGVFISSL
jgi:hypothetical protein